MNDSEAGVEADQDAAKGLEYGADGPQRQSAFGRNITGIPVIEVLACVTMGVLQLQRFRGISTIGSSVVHRRRQR